MLIRTCVRRGAYVSVAVELDAVSREAPQGTGVPSINQSPSQIELSANTIRFSY